MKGNEKLASRIARIAGLADAEASNEDNLENSQGDKRDSLRVSTYKDSVIYYSVREKEKCVIKDLSETGARIGCQGAPSLPEFVKLKVHGELWDCRVIWRNGFEAGLEYC